MAQQNTFASSFSIYAGSLRQQTQMAYQQAMQDIQSQQASELAQRQFLMDRLKLEYDLIKSLRSRSNSIRKNIKTSGLSESEQTRLINAESTSIRAYSQIIADFKKIDFKKAEELNKKYLLQPSTSQAIDSYIQSTPGNFDKTISIQDLKTNLGVGNQASDSNKEFNKLNKMFSSLETDEERQVAFDHLLKEKYKSYGDMVSIGNLTGEPAIDVMAKQLSNKLTNVKADDRLSKKEAEKILSQKLSGTTGLTLEQTKQLNQLNNRILSVGKKLDGIAKANPLAATITEEIKLVGDSLKDAISRAEKIRTQIDSPTTSDNRSLSVRAGQILLEQEATAKMGKALSKMSNSEIEALQLIKKAKALKEIDKESDEFINIYAKSSDPKDNNIISFFKYVDAQSGNAAKKEKLKTAALSRLIKAVDKKVAPKVTQKFFDIAAQREIEKNPLFNNNGDFRAIRPTMSLEKTPSKNKPNTKYQTLLQQDPSYSYGYIRSGSDQNGNPTFLYVSPTNIQAYKSGVQQGIPATELRQYLSPMPNSATYKEALELFEKSKKSK